MIWWRYVEDKKGRVLDLIDHVPPFFKIFWPYINKKMKRQIWNQGVGRHSNSDIQNIMYQDLKSLSDYLGK